MKLKRLGLEQFERLVSKTRADERTRAMLCAVLVDGRQQAEVAEAFGVKRQQLNLAVSRIDEIYRKSDDVGLGVVSVLIDLPEKLALELIEFSETLDRSNDQVLKNEVLARVLRTVQGAKTQLIDCETDINVR